MPGVSHATDAGGGSPFSDIKPAFWNPKMAPYIFGERNKIHIINLEKTQPMYAEAASFLKGVNRRRRHGALWSAPSVRRAMRSERKPSACAMPYVNQRWLGGMLTNFKDDSSIHQAIGGDHRVIHERLPWRSAVKKEATQLRREMEKLERSLGGIKDMTSLPDALFVVDVGHEKIAVQRG